MSEDPSTRELVIRNLPKTISKGEIIGTIAGLTGVELSENDVRIYPNKNRGEHTAVVKVPADDAQKIIRGTNKTMILDHEIVVTLGDNGKNKDKKNEAAEPTASSTGTFAEATTMADKNQKDSKQEPPKDESSKDAFQEGMHKNKHGKHHDIHGVLDWLKHFFSWHHIAEGAGEMIGSVTLFQILAHVGKMIVSDPEKALHVGKLLHRGLLGEDIEDELMRILGTTPSKNALAEEEQQKLAKFTNALLPAQRAKFRKTIVEAFQRIFEEMTPEPDTYEKQISWMKARDEHIDKIIGTIHGVLKNLAKCVDQNSFEELAQHYGFIMSREEAQNHKPARAAFERARSMLDDWYHGHAENEHNAATNESIRREFAEAEATINTDEYSKLSVVQYIKFWIIRWFEERRVNRNMRYAGGAPTSWIDRNFRQTSTGN